MAATPMPASELGYVPWTKKLCTNSKAYDDGVSNCDKRARISCNECGLVRYCSENCRNQHRSHHITDCHSPLRAKTWLPAFAMEKRETDGLLPSEPEAHIQQLWGNLPAFDVAKLGDNEGINYGGDIALYSPQTVDLRNVVTTVCALPDTFSGKLTFVINNLSAYNTARNFVILHIAATQEPKLAAELITHLWFSARLPEKMLAIIKERIIPHMDAVLQNWPADLEDDEESTSHLDLGPARTCDLSMSVSRLELSSMLWIFRADHDVPTALAERREALTDPLGQDFRDLELAFQQPAWRVSTTRYRKTGVLGPLRANLEAFTAINPTFFDAETGKFVLSNQTSPLVGWDIQRLINHATGFSKDDLHGQLYCFMRDLLEKFATRLQSKMRFAFHITAEGVYDTDHLEQFRPFDRIETAQLLEYDEFFLRHLLSILGPLLKSPQESIHATMITIFEAQWYQETREDLKHLEVSNLQAVANFISLVMFGLPVGSEDPEQDVKLSPVRILAARIFEPYDHLFKHYMTKGDFPGVANVTRMKMKEENEILKEWPKRLFKDHEQDGAKEAFHALLASQTRGHIRVVEWTRE